MKNGGKLAGITEDAGDRVEWTTGWNPKYLGEDEKEKKLKILYEDTINNSIYY